MNEIERDRELARRLGELGRADEADAPDFRQLLGRARSRQTAPARRPARALVALGAVLVLAAVAAWLWRRPPAAPVRPSGPSLSEWKAPTDSLLRTPGLELLESLPRVSSVPRYGGGTYEMARTKGVVP